MRLGMDSLAAIIESRYHISLFVPGSMFLFCGRRTNKINGLVWEGDGFLLFTKRVEDGQFSWPRIPQEARKFSPKEFRLLKDDYSIDSNQLNLFEVFNEPEVYCDDSLEHEVSEIIISSHTCKKASQKRDHDLESLPTRIFEHTLTKEEL